MKKSIHLLFVLLSFHAGLLTAQTKQDLSYLFRKLEANNRFAFKVRTIAVFPTGDSDTLVNQQYIDKEQAMYYYSNRLETVLMGRKWFLKEDHQNKVSSFFNLEKYNRKYPDMAIEIDSLSSRYGSGELIDSIVIYKGEIASYQQAGDVETYVIRFPEGYYIKSYELVYNKLLNIPLRITTEYLDNPFLAFNIYGNSTFILEYYDYKFSIPEQVFDISTYVLMNGDRVVPLSNKDYKWNIIF